MERVPVLIVGGGGAGLTASMLLAGLDVEHLLINSRPGRVRFNHELIELSQDEEGVTAIVRDNEDGHEYEVSADYLMPQYTGP